MALCTQQSFQKSLEKAKRRLEREKKMGGGFMGKRMGYKKGSKFPDLTGDGKVTFADILKGRGVINGKREKKIVGGMVDILLNEVNVNKAVEYIKDSISDLLKGKYPLYNFVTSNDS